MGRPRKGNALKWSLYEQVQRTLSPSFQERARSLMRAMLQKTGQKLRQPLTDGTALPIRMFLGYTSVILLSELESGV